MRKTIYFLVFFHNENFRFFKKCQIENGSFIGIRDENLEIYALKAIKEIWKIEKWVYKGTVKGTFTKFF